MLLVAIDGTTMSVPDSPARNVFFRSVFTVGVIIATDAPVAGSTAAHR